VKKRSVLGSGLGALLPSEAPNGVREVPVEHIRQNPRQPRTVFDPAALEDLAASINEHGIIQPLIVTQQDEGVYELIAGERRWRAAKLAGMQRVPVIVRETTPQELLELALIENVQRADLNPIEEARAYQALVDDFGMSDNQVAKRVGVNNRVTIANTRRLLKLPEQAQDAILKNSITAGHGRAILKLDTETQQLAALDVLIAHEMSVRDAERLSDLAQTYDGDVQRAFEELRQSQTPATESKRKSAQVAPTTQQQSETSADDHDVARQLERIVGERVNITRLGSTLRMTITFHTDEKLQEFFDALNNGYTQR
jgi:ParB family chromosome partitioning protein